MDSSHHDELHSLEEIGSYADPLQEEYIDLYGAGEAEKILPGEKNPDRAVEPEVEEEFRDDLARLYHGRNDEEIVALCHEGDALAEEYLLDKYKNFVRSKARSYFLIGADQS